MTLVPVWDGLGLAGKVRKDRDVFARLLEGKGGVDERRARTVAMIASSSMGAYAESSMLEARTKRMRGEHVAEWRGVVARPS